MYTPIILSRGRMGPCLALGKDSDRTWGNCNIWLSCFCLGLPDSFLPSFASLLRQCSFNWAIMPQQCLEWHSKCVFSRMFFLQTFIVWSTDPRKSKISERAKSRDWIMKWSFKTELVIGKQKSSLEGRSTSSKDTTKSTIVGTF
jgi:hypothetical protein